MIHELLVGKITLESIKYLFKEVVKEENITLRILTSLSDITTFGMGFWLFFNFTDEEEKNDKIPENIYS